jgi:hypothetical protein
LFSDALVNATVGNPVWISARAVNGSQEVVTNPYIFASLNQLPQLDNADIGGCTQFYCNYVNVIQFNVSEVRDQATGRDILYCFCFLALVNHLDKV